MKNKKNDNNESMSFIEKLIILIKGFFTKITPKINDFSDKSLEKVETWKKKTVTWNYEIYRKNS